MTKKFTHTLFALLVCISFPSFATDNFWQKFDGMSAPSRLPMNVTPNEYEIYTLTQDHMQTFLSQAGADPDKGTTLMLPAPGGAMREFILWETPMMEPGLAGKFPEIHTYTAYATDDPGVSAKLDYTDFGFSAMIYDGANSYMIDPYSNAADGYYIVFYQKDLKITENVAACQFNHQEELMPHNGIPVPLPATTAPAAKQNGTIRRFYRLAISCTGEYAQAVVGMNPTKPQVMSKIISTINRINGVYERELSVSFNLVFGNDDIIYTDPATDPYNCNLNLTCLINEVQANISATIDDNNYDIGHIFCTAGGGLAALGATCSSIKAMGTSTSGGPDDFGVPLHEMGHQFGANHTFSANSGGCLGNGAEANDYEPGSGSTIMSYGGLCDPNNIATFSDDYFHVASLVEIYNFLTTQGAGCGTTENGLNSVNIPDIIDSFNIPTNTPFEFLAPKAVASQPNASIRYSWEQYDLGNFGGSEAQNGNASSGPIMRSYLPDTSRLRDFPIDKILDNTYTGIGERLPMTNRTVRFKLTARSVYQAWGSFEFTDSVVRLQVGGSGNFRVTQPASNETWNPGEVKTITWTLGTTDQPPIDCHAVNIYLSLDDGETFPTLLVSNAPNTGTYNLTVPDVYTTAGRIKVKGLANVFYDVGKGKLNITGTNGINPIQASNTLLVYPNPASDQIHIQRQAKGFEAATVSLCNILGRQVWAGKMTNEITIPCSSLARGIYLIRVTDDQTGTKATYKVNLR